MAQTLTLPLLAALILGGVFSLPSPDRVVVSVRETFESGDYQEDLPGPTPAAERSHPDPSRRERVRVRRRRSDEAVLEDVGSTLLWALLAVAVLLAGLWVARRLPGREARVPPSDVPVEPGEAPPPESVALADAEALAAAGRHDEAVHVLLLVAVDELGRRERLSDSATSREILDDLPADGDLRRALGRLVTAVEWCLFGGRPADAEAYEICRQSYAVLHTRLRGGRARA